LEHLGRAAFTTLLAAGIVNPMGPTLIVLGIDGEVKQQSTSESIELTLHPFSTVASRIALAHIGDPDDLWRSADQVAKEVAKSASCPTLLLPSKLLDANANNEIWAAALRHYADGSTTLDRVRQYPGDPWTRVQREMDRTELATTQESRRLTASEAYELAATQLAAENLHAEFEAFMYAWHGSIDFQRQHGSPLASTAMSDEALGHYLALVAQTTNIPWGSGASDDR
jgi:hypothetical protein